MAIGTVAEMPALAALANPALAGAIKSIAQALIGFLLLAGLFWVMESLWPEQRHQPKWRRDSFTDMLYWFAGYGIRAVASFLTLVVIVAVVIFIPHTGIPAIASQPGWLQVIEVIVIGDVLGYWSHRIFHKTPLLWPFHAVHHSPEQVDWLSAARVHPLDTIVSRMVTVLPLFLLGYSHLTLGGYAIFLAVYPIYLHANVSWDYGPFRWLIASPAYHRWHHASDVEALDKNFSGLLPVVDIIFGTAYFPKGRHPVSYGLYREQMPRGIMRQWAYPFHRKQSAATPPNLLPERQPVQQVNQFNQAQRW